MSEPEKGDEKEHDASARKLEKAREQGDIARSTDILTATSYAGFLLAFSMFGLYAVQTSATVAMQMLDQADVFSTELFAGGGPGSWAVVSETLLPFGIFFVLPAVLVLTILFATDGIAVSWEKVTVKWSRISVIGSFNQKFGLDGLMEFAKSFLKLVIFSAILVYFLSDRIGLIEPLQNMDANLSISYLFQTLVDFLFLVLLIFIPIGAFDFFWQRYSYAKRNRMTRKEVLDEMKESDGDPQQKAERRRRAQDVANTQMMADVQKADVIIVNPTHFAVALKWTRADQHAPVCVAKGVDAIAAEIRRRAEESGVPIHSDPPTARALFASVEVGQSIKPDHYRAVAAAIRFSEVVRRKRRSR